MSEPIVRQVGAAGAAAVLVGALWPTLIPLAGRFAGPGEDQATGDVVLLALTALAGVLSGAVLRWRPGPRPSVRLLVVLAAVTAGGALAWQLGVLLGAPALHTYGVLLVWPLATTVTVLAATALTPARRSAPSH